jgi:integrase
MRYDEIRAVLHDHFSRLLVARKNRIGSDGPLSKADEHLLRSSAGIGQMAIQSNGQLLVRENDTDELLERFIETYKLNIQKGSVSYKQLSTELNRAYHDYVSNVLEYNDSLQNYNYDTPPSNNLVEAFPAEIIVTIKQMLEFYVNECNVGEQWAEKTKIEKSDHISLLLEVIGRETDVRRITSDKAREVKSILLKYPKNRNKNPQTRGRPLNEIMSMVDLQTLNPQTINKYLQTYGTMFGWAKRHGFISDNVFEKLTIKRNKRASVDREAFTGQHIFLILQALTEASQKPARKAYQKWGPLIGLYTGARLNEIAQIHLTDIKQSEGIWYFDLNDESEDKKLKTDASRRLVPVHDKLIMFGLLNHVADLRKSGAKKLFPDFTYCPKNGWGRSLGRWFNDHFLDELGIKSPSLVFHSLRHTVTNNLMRMDVPESIIQAIIGHTRANMLSRHYFNSGYKLDQIRDAIHKLPY